MDVATLFADLERKYGLPSGYLARTYQIESSSGRDLYNDKSGAAGPFQFMPKTAKAYGLSDPYDTPAAADATARLAVDNRAYLQSKGVENPSAAHLYLAHQQGAGGALKLLNDGGPAGAIVGDKAVAWNGGAPSMAGSQFAQSVMDKYNGAQRPSAEAPWAGALTVPRQDAFQPIGAAGGGAAMAQPQNVARMAQAGMATVTDPASAAAKRDFNFAGLGQSGMALMAAGAPKPGWQPGPAAQAHRAQPVNFAGLLSPGASSVDDLQRRYMMGLLG